MRDRFGAPTLGTNRLHTLVESYRLATEQPPPPGQILVHSEIGIVAGSYKGARGFRAWWTTPCRKFVLCDCGWRPDLGTHYRVQRPVKRSW
jgi:hypothetical protein